MWPSLESAASNLFPIGLCTFAFCYPNFKTCANKNSIYSSLSPKTVITFLSWRNTTPPLPPPPNHPDSFTHMLGSRETKREAQPLHPGSSAGERHLWRHHNPHHGEGPCRDAVTRRVNWRTGHAGRAQEKVQASGQPASVPSKSSRQERKGWPWAGNRPRVESACMSRERRKGRTAG